MTVLTGVMLAGLAGSAVSSMTMANAKPYIDFQKTQTIVQFQLGALDAEHTPFWF